MKDSPFIDKRAKPIPIQTLNPRIVGSHLENFGRPKRHDINRCFPTISVIMTLEFERMSVTNFEKPDQWHASCQSAAQSSHQSKRSALINQIFLYPQVLSKGQDIEESFANYALSLLSSRPRQAEEWEASVVVKT